MPKKKKRAGKPRHRQPTSPADEQLPRPPQNPNPTMADEPQLHSQSESQSGDDPQPEEPPPQDTAASSDVTVPDLPPTEEQRTAAGQRLALLNQNLRPIPFSPQRPLDLSKHEELFRALGLWDLAHLELDREIRSDLLAFLIANYDPASRCSHVNDVLISVSRTDLAEALGLPSHKDEKGDALESDDSLLELFKREESVSAIEDFMSSYVLFEDDMCILPPEVVEASQLVKEGMPHKVDWAGLMWVLVEKELLEAPRSGDCHYASHLQCLLKYQRPGLLGKEGEPKAEPASVPQPESSMDGSATEEDGGDVKMRSLEDFQGMGVEEQGQGLSLGLSGKQEHIMDGLEDCKEGGEGEWIAEGKDDSFQHCLQRCNSNDVSNAVKGMEFENLCKGEEGGDGERYADDVSAKFPSLERLTSMDLRAMDSVHVSYSPQLNPLDPSDGDFLSMRTDVHKKMTVDSGLDGSIPFESNGQRHIDEEEDDRHQFPQNNQQKRLRTGELWEHMPSKFDTCMEQVECSVRKVKMLYAEKEQACMDAHLQLQYLNGLLQEKDQIIQSIDKTRVEELQKWQQTVCQYERELNAMAHVMLGYKKALRETRRKFAEYREKCSQTLEPLYSDVGGAGGLVLTSREIERQRLEKEEMHQTAIEMINDFETGWLTEFDHFDACITTKLHERLVQLDGEVKLLKEKFEKIP